MLKKSVAYNFENNVNFYFCWSLIGHSENFESSSKALELLIFLVEPGGIEPPTF